MTRLSENERNIIEIRVNQSAIWKIPVEQRREWLDGRSNIIWDKVGEHLVEIRKVQDDAMNFVISSLTDNQIERINWVSGMETLNRVIVNFKTTYADQSTSFFKYLRKCPPFSYSKEYGSMGGNKNSPLAYLRKAERAAIINLYDLLTSMSITSYDRLDQEQMNSIADSMGISVSKLVRYLEYTKILNPDYIDMPLGDDGSTSLGDIISDPTPSPEDKLVIEDLVQSLLSELANVILITVRSDINQIYMKCFFSNDIIKQLKPNQGQSEGYDLEIFRVLLPIECMCIPAMERPYVSFLYEVEIQTLTLEWMCKSRLMKSAKDVSIAEFRGVGKPTVSAFLRRYECVKKDIYKQQQAM